MNNGEWARNGKDRTSRSQARNGIYFSYRESIPITTVRITPT